MIDLKGHSAFITGSTRGVGRAIAVAFARAGANVVLHGKGDLHEGEAVLAECRQAGVQAALIGGDLAVAGVDALNTIAADADRAMGGIDILVNNAGAYFDLPYLDMTPDRFDQTLRLNVRTPYFLTQRFAKRWIAENVNGRVLMVGSINGRLAEEDSTAYDTSKGAVEMMVRTLAVALAPKGIRVNGVAPGLVRTPQTKWVDDKPDAARWIAHHTPDGQIPDADVCGPAAVYLCSDAAWHVHGQMLVVDGGMSVWQQPAGPSEGTPR